MSEESENAGLSSKATREGLEGNYLALITHDLKAP